MTGVACALCGRPVDPTSRETYRRITGWDRKGRAGGSDVSLRRPTGEYAHPECVTRERYGVPDRQEAML